MLNAFVPLLVVIIMAKRLILLLLVMALLLPISTQARTSPSGKAYDYDVYGDITIISNDVNETWYDTPIQANRLPNGSLGFNWDFPVVSFQGNRIQTAILYMDDNGNDTLTIEWLSDSVDIIIISLYNYSMLDWTTVWSSFNTPNFEWQCQNHIIMSDNRNGTTVPIKFELVKNLNGGGGNWISQLYIDYAYLLNSTIPEMKELTTVTANEPQFKPMPFVEAFKLLIAIAKSLLESILNLF